MKRFRGWGPAALAAALLASGAAAQPARVVPVRTDADLRAALARAGPGTVLELAPGTYGGLHHAGLKGDAAAPVVLRSADPKRPAVFTGQLQLSDTEHVILQDFVSRGSRSNGLNLDDGGTFETPAHHLVLRGLVVEDNGPRGNLDGIKLSGVDDFLVEDCTVRRWGSGGSAVDTVGCHRGLFLGCRLEDQDARAATGIQAKGGSSEIVVRGCEFAHAGMRAVNIGGSTGEAYFRPQGADYEARRILVLGCTFAGVRSADRLCNGRGVAGALQRPEHRGDLVPLRGELVVLLGQAGGQPAGLAGVRDGGPVRPAAGRPVERGRLVAAIRAASAASGAVAVERRRGRGRARGLGEGRAAAGGVGGRKGACRPRRAHVQSRGPAGPGPAPREGGIALRSENGMSFRISALALLAMALPAMAARPPPKPQPKADPPARKPAFDPERIIFVGVTTFRQVGSSTAVPQPWREKGDPMLKDPAISAYYQVGGNSSQVREEDKWALATLSDNLKADGPLGPSLARHVTFPEAKQGAQVFCILTDEGKWRGVIPLAGYRLDGRPWNTLIRNPGKTTVTMALLLNEDDASLWVETRLQAVAHLKVVRAMVQRLRQRGFEHIVRHADGTTENRLGPAPVTFRSVGNKVEVYDGGMADVRLLMGDCASARLGLVGEIDGPPDCVLPPERPPAKTSGPAPRRGEPSRGTTPTRRGSK